VSRFSSSSGDLPLFSFSSSFVRSLAEEAGNERKIKIKRKDKDGRVLA
jgi:hypothetical protein